MLDLLEKVRLTISTGGVLDLSQKAARIASIPIDTQMNSQRGEAGRQRSIDC